jgi:hypothetical protein
MLSAAAKIEDHILDLENYSMANYSAYKIPVNDEGINMLTNKKSVKKENGSE